MSEDIARPQHYGGKDNPFEVRKVIAAWRLGFNLGNVLKYVGRAGKKGNLIAHANDLIKARQYLDFEIEELGAAQGPSGPTDEERLLALAIGNPGNRDFDVQEIRSFVARMLASGTTVGDLERRLLSQPIHPLK